MSRSRTNNQLFALKQPPPEFMDISGRRFRLVRVFKHDFFAATCLYEAAQPSSDPSAMDKVVVKFGRDQGFCGLPADWIGTMHADHEEAIYRCLDGVRGVPRWAGRLATNCFAIEYIDGRPMDHPPAPPPGFFDRLREVVADIHARGVAYTDSNKRSNILIGPDDQPFIIDYQISMRRRDDLPWPLRNMIRAMVDYLMRKDVYHLLKHKRRMAPQELSPQEEQSSRDRGRLHALHRMLSKPYRSMRRRFLQRQFEKGQLISPTAGLEDHYQPEKETWRKEAESNQ